MTKDYASGKLAGDWQLIETAPLDNIAVLVTVPGAHKPWVAEAYYDAERESWWLANQDWSDNHADAIHPTHWMPLPEPAASLPPSQTRTETE